MNAGRHLLHVSVGLALTGILATGCSGDDGFSRIPSDVKDYDRELDTLDIVCRSELIMTGSYTLGDPKPAGTSGCWGIGAWKVNGTVQRKGCDPQPNLLSEYVYEVTRDTEADATIAVYSEDKQSKNATAAISANSDGCIGLFTHYERDIKAAWDFHINLKDETTLEGTGTFTVYEFDPHPEAKN